MVTYSAVFTEHFKGWWQEPVEELQQKGAAVWTLQKSRKRVHPGDH